MAQSALLGVFRRMLTLAAPIAALCVFAWPDTKRPPTESTATTANVQQSPNVARAIERDLPADELKQAEQEFGQLNDSSLETGVEEMPAYWRLMQWSTRRSIDQWRELSVAQASYGLLVTQPQAQRAQPVKLNLNVCRILSWDAPPNELGVKKLYEVWGWTEDSRGGMYVLVTPDLPAGMQVGERVREQGVVYGYFCKLQGYVAANAGAAAPRQAAPLIIGRMDRYVPPQVAVVGPGELRRLGLGLLLAISLVGTVALRSPWRRKTSAPTITTSAQATQRLEDWLSHEELEFPDDAGSRPESLTPRTAYQAMS
ncbi:MAG: hypothetical protein U0795_26250 [Pirellulales bacterium]